LAKAAVKETSASLFDDKTIVRLSEIMGKQYEHGKMAITDADPNRPVPVISLSGFGKDISGFHLGAGEFTMIELLQKTAPKQSSLLLIDEVETSLHPSAQRRLIRDLAEMCRVTIAALCRMSFGDTADYQSALRRAGQDWQSISVIPY
jgi:predicted ATP-dependent endonuclease of OLD family